MGFDLESIFDYPSDKEQTTDKEKGKDK
jgi:hypothetical protein